MVSTPQKRAREETKKTKVILDHDGGVDDLVALAILLSDPDHFEMIGCCVIDADCYIQEGFSVSGKLAALMQTKPPVSAKSTKAAHRFPSFPIVKSSLKGVHPFPHEWRVDAKKMDDLPVLNTPFSEGWEKRFAVEGPGEEHLAQWVLKSDVPVTVCVTGPLTNIAYALRTHGKAFADKVEKLVIMGGAVDVPGNVDPAPPAEWNFYWDAPSAKEVLESPLLRPSQKILFSLDATNHVPVDSPFVQSFGQDWPCALATFLGSSWAQCTFLTHGYFAWDALTAAYVLDTSVATLREVGIELITESGAAEGQSKPKEGGAVVSVADKVDNKKFYEQMRALGRFC